MPSTRQRGHSCKARFRLLRGVLLLAANLMTFRSDIRADVVVDWSFNQSSGTIAPDSGPNGVNGTLSGGATWTAGYGQNAVSIGGDEFVDFTQAGSPKVPGAISNLSRGSIGVRFFVDSFPADQASHPILPILWMGRDYGGDGQFGLTIEIGHAPPYSTPDHSIYFTIFNSESKPIFCFNSMQFITAGAWHSFVVVISDSGNTGYLDTVEMTDRHYNFGNPSSTDFFSSVTSPSSALWVGKGFFGLEPNPYHFNGQIQNLRIFDQPLTAQQVVELYSVPEPTSLALLTAGVLGLFARLPWRRRSTP